MTIYISIFMAAAILLFALWAKIHGGWRRAHQRVLGWLILLYGIFLSSLTGSYTAFVLPGIGGIALGAGTGAAVGLGTWLVLGTVGVATGGIGLAIGALGMAAIGAIFGGIGGAAGGFGFQTVSYPLVHWAFWLPLIVIGLYFIWGIRIKRGKGTDAQHPPE